MFKLFLASVLFAVCCLMLYMLLENIYFDSVGRADASRWKARRDKVAMAGKLAAAVSAVSLVCVLAKMLTVIHAGGAPV